MGTTFSLPCGGCQGHQRMHVTPYMHILVYHVPGMLRRYDNLRQFSDQGKDSIVYLLELSLLMIEEQRHSEEEILLEQLLGRSSGDPCH